MRFFNPQILWLCPVILIAFPVLWSFFKKKNSEKIFLFANHSLLTIMMNGLDYNQLLRRRFWRFICILLASVFAIIAVARPQLGTHFENLKSEGLDLVFLLDVSNSMLTEDVVPNRLKKAKHILKNFSEKFSGDRVGVVAFAGSAYPAVPLTTDYDYLRQTLEVLDESTVQNQGSDLAGALDIAISLLDRGGVNQKKSENEDSKDSSRVLIILSDGEETESSDAESIKNLVQTGVRIYSIGIGSLKGGPIPLRDHNGNLNGYKKDRSGSMVLSKLETEKLEKFAKDSGGRFYTASSNEGEVTEILEELKSLDRSQGGLKQVLVYDEYFQVPLLVAVLFLWISFLIRERPTFLTANSAEKTAKVDSAKPLLLSITFIFFLLSSSASVFAGETTLKEYKENKSALEAYSAKRFDEAIDHFSKAQASNPDQDEHHISLGDAYLRSGDTENAIKEFDQARNSIDHQIAAKGSFNKGKAFSSAKQQDKAIESFQEGLEKELAAQKPDPELVQKFKRALEQEMDQKNQQKQDDQQNQKQDDKNKDDKNKNQDSKNNQDKKDSDKNNEKEKQKNNPPQQNARKKPDFKPEKLSEEDARKIMRQLGEQEKKTQQRILQKKTERKQSESNGKDW